METELHLRVKRLILSRQLTAGGETVIVAVSGGADSLTLLHILNRIKDDLKIRLHVATLDHGLRGDAGAADAQFVEDTARAWGLPFTRGKVDVNALAAEWHEGIEAAARRARYEFLANVARKAEAWIVAAAHNADDQAETVLMHLIRGAGLQGLKGMSLLAPLPYADTDDFTLIRPLLLTPRAEIDAYVRENGLSPRSDATNDDTTYTRNRIRRELIPLLRTYNPQISRLLAQTADMAEADHRALDTFFLKYIGDAPASGSGRMAISLKKLHSLPLALQRRYIRFAVDHVRGAPDGETGYSHIENALRLINEGETGAITLLGDGIRARLEYGKLFIEAEQFPLDEGTLPLMHADESVAVTTPGVSEFGAGCRIEAQVMLPASSGHMMHLRLAIPEGAKIHLRTRQQGDTFSPLGMDGKHKTLKRWMIDAKVPASIRDRVPLLIVNDQIAAILWRNPAIDERFAQRDTPGERIVFFTIHQRG